MYIYQIMSNNFGFIDIILLGLIAGFIILRLRNMLGRRTGHEGKATSVFDEKKYTKFEPEADVSVPLKKSTEDYDKKAFLKSKVSSTPLFINNHNKIDSLDIVYLGSVLQYIQDYKKLLLSLIRKSPAFFLITDNFMGTHSTYATVEVNMAGRKMAYWIFQLNEIKEIFSSNGYQLIYSSKNHQPYHNFDNFPEKYQVHDSCNLLFQKMNFV